MSKKPIAMSVFFEIQNFTLSYCIIFSEVFYVVLFWEFDMNREKICGCSCGLPLEASDIRLDIHLVINQKPVLVRAEWI
ncbi:MAG: hypothetical protein COY98_02795 [Candidatus Yonathbacteria bacterium CG_4_10_14_0_8_um_filter_43_17]|uniref:Uncharacterized protein n=1 Tax=Candidatus Yonathbacteria bacterium CG_4_10_14_0_8_um_filter_43_17 TaxID=1975099 RepID=A0A2M7Q4H1_9BACT|nr:MAG: hypothetical protein COY98_02795 [Candidatus Yonathbacteria bacterium CG_4_10_14_0_8_um_filter_43_17]